MIAPELYFLSARISDQIPSGYIRVTHWIKVESELNIIQGIWEYLKSTEAVLEVRGGKLAFWRKRNPDRQNYRERIRRSTKTVGRRYVRLKAA